MVEIKDLLSPDLGNQEKVTCEPQDRPVTNSDLLDAFEKNLFAYDGKREDKGQNRADWVDEINKWIGAPLGSPYCIASLLFNLKKLEVQFPVKFDLPIYAGTQLFWLAVLKEYRVYKPKRFALGIFRHRANPSHGHAVYCISEADSEGNFETFEFNTNSAGSRDGDGAMRAKRNIAGSNSLELLGFVNLEKCWSSING